MRRDIRSSFSAACSEFVVLPEGVVCGRRLRRWRLQLVVATGELRCRAPGIGCGRGEDRLDRLSGEEGGVRILCAGRNRVSCSLCEVVAFLTCWFRYSIIVMTVEND